MSVLPHDRPPNPGKYLRPRKKSNKPPKTKQPVSDGRANNKGRPNPNIPPGPGRPRNPPAFTYVSNLTKKELAQIGSMICRHNVDEIREIARSPKTSALVVMYAAVVMHIIKKGDISALDLLMNRIVGKVKDEVHATGVTGRVIVTLPPNGREAVIPTKPEPPIEEQPSFDFDHTGET